MTLPLVQPSLTTRAISETRDLARAVDLLEAAAENDHADGFDDCRDHQDDKNFGHN